MEKKAVVARQKEQKEEGEREARGEAESDYNNTTGTTARDSFHYLESQNRIKIIHYISVHRKVSDPLSVIALQTLIVLCLTSFEQ